MEYHQKMRRNLRLLFWGRAFLETKALLAIIVLFYIHRGVSLEQVFYLNIVWSITSLITEIPSGYLADRLGLKRMMLLGSVLFFISVFGRYFVTGFWEFVWVFVVMASAFSCFSGTEEALLYESLKENGQQQYMTKFNGRLFSARSLFRIAVPTIGAYIAKDLFEWQFLLVNSIDAKKSVAKREIGIFKQSLETIKEHPWMLRVVLNKFLVFYALFFTARVHQPLFIENGISTIWIGWFFLFVSFFSYIGTRHLGFLVEKFGSRRFLFWTAVAIIVFLVISITSATPWIVFVGLLLVEVFSTIRDPAFSDLINHCVESGSRATTLSNLNLIKGLLDIPILLLAGYVSSMGTHYPLMIGILTCLLALVVFPIKKTDESSCHTK
jgi:MFS family permease